MILLVIKKIKIKKTYADFEQKMNYQEKEL